MLGLGVTCYRDVIDIDKGEVYVLKYCVHESLETLCLVLQAKLLVKEFPQSKRGNDGHLGNVTGVDRDLVVAADKVSFRKNFDIS